MTERPTARPDGGRWGPRERPTVRGLLPLAAAVVLAGLVLYVAVTAALSRASDGEARATADRVAELVAAGRLPEVLPSGAGQVVQVVDDEGRVLAAGLTADRLTPLLSAEEREHVASGGAVTVPGHRAALSGDLRAVGVTADDPTRGGQVLVVVASPTADAEAARSVVRRLLAVLVPVALLALAVLAWRWASSVLRPVAQTWRSQREFVADAAHELRSPLASMRTQLEVAERLGEGGTLPQDLLPEVDRLSRLVEDLLTLARSGVRTPATTAVDLAALLREVAGRRTRPRVPIGVDCPDGLRVEGVRQDLVRALDNLVDNAVRHAATRVEVRAADRGATVEVTVRDDGAGIAPQDRERVFERFARLDEARARDDGGSGLGLAITRELLARGGGRIRLEDAEPGLRAVVVLPRAGEISAVRHR